jgi:hypothetical protein
MYQKPLFNAKDDEVTIEMGWRYDSRSPSIDARQSEE